MLIRKAQDRGYANHGWLESWHSFSFADYHDPAHMHFGVLRVINDDIVQPEHGFDMHPHRDMEILTYVLNGTLTHQDSMGNRKDIQAGDVQLMSAGTGILHSEYNHSHIEPVHLLQIWIFPNQKDLTPNYQQKAFTHIEKYNRWCLLASPDGREDALVIHQNIHVFSSIVEGALDYPIPAQHKVYLHVATGEVRVNGSLLRAGDALMAKDTGRIILTEGKKAEVLLFDMEILT